MAVAALLALVAGAGWWGWQEVPWPGVGWWPRWRGLRWGRAQLAAVVAVFGVAAGVWLGWPAGVLVVWLGCGSVSPPGR